MGQKHRLRVFENRALKKIFGSKRDKVTGKSRRLHNEELNYLYSEPNIVCMTKSRQMRWVGARGTYARWETGGVYTGVWREDLRKRTT
jgi:hypothetical protein